MQASIVGLACLMYAMWRPVSNGQILYPALALLTVLSLVNFRRVPGPRAATPFVVCGYLMLVAGLLGSGVGAAHNTPGLAQQATVWLGALLVWGSWASGFRVDTIRRTLTAITITTAVLSGLIVAYVLGGQGVLPNLVPTSILDAQGAGFDLTDSGSAIRLYGLSTLAAAGPLVTSALFVGRDTLLPPRKLLAVASALSILASLMAGRRAILAVVLLSPLFAWLIERALRPRVGPPKLKPRWIVFLFVVVLAGPFVVGTGWANRAGGAVQDALAVFFSAGSGSGGNALSDIVRHLQTGELLAGWSQHLFFGSGLGAVLRSGFQRSDDRPWMFELQYHQMLFDVGAVGVGLVIAAVVATWVGIRRAARTHPEHTPVLVATVVAAVALLLANASNPYLQAVGHGWGIALTVGVANAILRQPRSLANEHLLADAVGSEPDVGPVLHRVTHRSQRVTRAAIRELCEHLAATNTRYPGTNLTLRYEIKNQP